MTDTMHTPAVVVSCDSHVGPLLRAQLRDYCPKEHLDEFDAFAAEHEATHGFTHTGEYDGAAFVAEHPNMSVAGHHDITARLADMDRDGVAAEVIFHFSQNGEPLPFVANGGDATVKYFWKGDFLYLGFDVRDTRVQSNATEDEWDGFTVSITSRTRASYPGR